MVEQFIGFRNYQETRSSIGGENCDRGIIERRTFHRVDFFLGLAEDFKFGDWSTSYFLISNDF